MAKGRGREGEKEQRVDGLLTKHLFMTPFRRCISNDGTLLKPATGGGMAEGMSRAQE